MRPTRLRVTVGLAAVGIVVLALLSGCSKSTKHTASCATGLNDHTNQQFCGLGLEPPQPRPNFPVLTDDTGKPFTFGTATAGKPTLLFFGYTTCPDVCPTTMADMAIALQKLPPATQAKVQVVFVSTDPDTDTVPVIKAWLDKFDTGLPSQFIGLRGTTAQVLEAEVAAHVTTSSDEGKTHSAEVLLYGADDYARVSFLQSDDESGDMAHDLADLVK